MKSQEFREVAGNSEDIVINVYQHVDNGGFSVSGDIYGTLSIDFSFHSLANTSISMPQIDIKGLIKSLQEYQKRLDELEILRKLKGE